MFDIHQVFRDIIYYIRNRWLTKTHSLTSNLPRGQYQDLDNRLLHCNFDALVDFVEIELAQLQKCVQEQVYHFSNGRCAKAGVDNLLWASRLTHPDDDTILLPQALGAQEILALYQWWTNERSTRKDPFAEMSDDYEYKDTDFSGIALEEQYYKEDTEMLVRLMQVRSHLWT